MCLPFDLESALALKTLQHPPHTYDTTHTSPRTTPLSTHLLLRDELAPLAQRPRHRALHELLEVVLAGHLEHPTQAWAQQQQEQE